MLIIRKFFSKIINDNDEVYLAHLEGVISSIDELSSLEITKSNDEYKFRLTPSLPKYTPLLLEEILKYHNLLKIRLDLSKSIKSSGTLSFKIKL